PFHAGPKQIQAHPIVVDVVQIRCPRRRVEHEPIAQDESHFLYGWQERDSHLRAACRLSDSGGLPPSPFRVDPKQIQARRIVAAQPQAEFSCPCFAAAYPPIAQEESHFLYVSPERDSDPRAPCRSSDSGHLPPRPSRAGSKQIQVRRIVAAGPQTEF